MISRESSYGRSPQISVAFRYIKDEGCSSRSKRRALHAVVTKSLEMGRTRRESFWRINCWALCCSSEIMTPLTVSVKMSPYEKGDSFIERERTATVVGVEPDHEKGNHRRGGGHANRGFSASTTKTAGSVPGGGGCRSGAREPRTSARARPSLSGEDVRVGGSPDDVRRVQLRPPG
jgi:hypothetical protein